MLKINQKIENGILMIRISCHSSGQSRRVDVRRVKTPNIRLTDLGSAFVLALPIEMACKHSKRVQAIIDSKATILLQRWQDSQKKEKIILPKFTL